MVKKAMESHSYAINKWFVQYYEKQNCWVSWDYEGVKLTFESTSHGPI